MTRRGMDPRDGGRGAFRREPSWPPASPRTRRPHRLTNRITRSSWRRSRPAARPARPGAGHARARHRRRQPARHRARQAAARGDSHARCSALIEQYATGWRRGSIRSPTTSRRAPTDGRAVRVRRRGKVSFKAPIKYPWNLMAASANYKAHAEGMGAAGRGDSRAGARSRRGPAGRASGPGRVRRHGRRAHRPVRDAPIMFAKSPRSCIIDPGEPFYIVDGRGRTDYEGELAIIMGPRPGVSRCRASSALDYVFGYSIMQDLSDRGSERLREVTMFPGANWFDGKSIDRAAPFGPVIVPKEFMPKAPSDLRITTKLNGTIVQDARTSKLIWSEAAPRCLHHLAHDALPRRRHHHRHAGRHRHGAAEVPEARRRGHDRGRGHRHADDAVQGAVGEAGLRDAAIAQRPFGREAARLRLAGMAGSLRSPGRPLGFASRGVRDQSSIGERE